MIELEHIGYSSLQDIAYERIRDALRKGAFQPGEGLRTRTLAKALGVSQPTVSKHLKVLRDVHLVHARRDGRRILYRTNADAIRPLHEWASRFERYWSHQLHKIKERAEENSN